MKPPSDSNFMLIDVYSVPLDGEPSNVLGWRGPNSLPIDREPLPCERIAERSLPC